MSKLLFKCQGRGLRLYLQVQRNARQLIPSAAPNTSHPPSRNGGRRANQKLKESEERYRLVPRSQRGIWDWYCATDERFIVMTAPGNVDVGATNLASPCLYRTDASGRLAENLSSSTDSLKEKCRISDFHSWGIPLFCQRQMRAIRVALCGC